MTELPDVAYSILKRRAHVLHQSAVQTLSGADHAPLDCRDADDERAFSA